MILCLCLNPSVDSFIWLDRITPGGVHRVRRESKYPGGKGVHVALALKELGNAVALMGFWGGATGTWIRGECERRDIATHGPEVAEWTRTCLTIKSDSVFDETEILGTGPEVNAPQVDALRQKFFELLGEARIVAISGSLPPGAPTALYAELVALARQRNVPVYLDCTGDPLSLALEEQPHGVHLNRREAEAITGKPSAYGASRALLAHCRLASVTDGSNGAHFATRDRLLHAVCPIDNGHSAVGSGDCLTAGLCHAHFNRYDLDRTARLAAACGAANLLCPDLGMLRRRDVHRLEEKTILRSLS